MDRIPGRMSFAAVCALALLITALAGYVVSSQEAPGKRPGPPRQMAGGFDLMMGPPPPGDMLRISDRLGLSESQRESLRGLVRSRAESMRAAAEQLPPLYRRVQEEMLAPRPDRAAIRKTLRQIMDLRLRMAETGMEFWLDVRRQLTPEQDQRLAEVLRSRMHDRFRDRFTGPRPDGREPDPGAR